MFVCYKDMIVMLHLEFCQSDNTKTSVCIIHTIMNLIQLFVCKNALLLWQNHSTNTTNFQHITYIVHFLIFHYPYSISKITDMAKLRLDNSSNYSIYCESQFHIGISHMKQTYFVLPRLTISFQWKKSVMLYKAKKNLRSSSIDFLIQNLNYIIRTHSTICSKISRYSLKTNDWKVNL